MIERKEYMALLEKWRDKKVIKVVTYVGKVGDAEIDFVVIKGEYKEYYQVSLSVRDENTMNRELAPLQAIQDHYPKYLLTMDNDPEVLHDGIRQIYVLDWLVEGD
jgi:predicted AAA+ superfamily ATPase